MSPVLVDSHCHLNLLDFSALGTDLAGVMDNARAHDVAHMLCVSINLETLPDVLAAAHAHPHVYASVGVHPNERQGREPGVDELAALAQSDRVVAIGETGLDYYRSGGDLTWQCERFRRHIAAAKAARKPLIVHSRAARDDTLRILREEGADAVGGVLHCFTEDRAMAEAAIELNFYISFSGIVTFNSAKTLQQAAAHLPLERMLVETDSPYLAPVPYRGKTNQPAYVHFVAKHIAALRGQPLALIAERTTQNFMDLFAIQMTDLGHQTSDKNSRAE